ncbi:hypothetical protein ALC57_07960 [Trachymyrmex cornetzi]|uniref:Retrotransposon gag domain-containing protein n=1 Tax=Trachymyrmex cornetzi TaxID=471704 RepID=A0A151J7D0_9HYME|nr:hypothetical protein ALC57_07960 [Trachymyrmex cornetzi]
MIRSPIATRRRARMESPEGAATDLRDTQPATEEASPRIEETSSTSPMQTVLHAVLREIRQLREEQRRARTAFAESLRQRNVQISQLQERLREIPSNQLSPSNNTGVRDAVASVRVRDSRADVFGRVGSVAGGDAVASVDNLAAPLRVDTDGGAAGNHFDASVTLRGQLGVKLKPDTYEGNAPLREYFAQFNLIARANRWEDQTKIAILVSCLRGKARAILENMQNLETLRFEELRLKSKLEMCFGETQSLQGYYSQFTSRRQKFGENCFVGFGCRAVITIGISGMPRYSSRQNSVRTIRLRFV